MISLSSEMTDAKGSHAERGWAFFDRDCQVCVATVSRFRHSLEKRGFGFAALQDPRVQALLNLPDAELLREMRVATSEGNIYGGAEAIVHLAGRIWWAWPFYAAAKLPGISNLLAAGYRWFADHRTCSAGVCSIRTKGGRA
jgi:predicted DCC family thiol-disulfide oxidoreductase YuxK